MSESAPTPSEHEAWQRPPQHSASGPSGPRANFGQRLAAYLVDGIVLIIVQLVVQALFGRTSGTANLLNFAIALAYIVYLEGSPAGQTIGKKVLGIRVVDFDTGGPLGFVKATIRYFARILSALPCALGYFWMIWDRERQTWHDKIASSVVVPTSAYPVDKWPG